MQNHYMMHRVGELYECDSIDNLWQEYIHKRGNIHETQTYILPL